MPGRCDLARDQVLGDGGKVIVDPLPVCLQPGFVPRWPEFAATADICQHEYSVSLEPQLAARSTVRGLLGKLESAICRQERGVRAVILHGFAMDDEVRHFC